MAQHQTISKPEKVETAVEWLVEQLKTFVTLDEELTWDKIFEQAKQMEKKQIIKAHNDGDVWSGEQYYKETYGK